jgi:hypothetical protein
MRGNRAFSLFASKEVEGPSVSSPFCSLLIDLFNYPLLPPNHSFAVVQMRHSTQHYIHLLKDIAAWPGAHNNRGLAGTFQNPRVISPALSTSVPEPQTKATLTT